MSTTHIQSASIATQASVYFDGKCVSHSLTMADGSKKSVGVVLAAELTFGTAAPEESVTVPVIMPWPVCPAKEKAQSANSNHRFKETMGNHLQKVPPLYTHPRTRDNIARS